MAGPIYYFPGKVGAMVSEDDVRARAKALGLDGTFDSCGLFIQPCDVGPDKNGGLMVAVQTQPPARMPNVGDFPDEQEWIHIKKRDYWIGFQKGNRPTPDDLQRNGKLLKDYTIKLMDDNEWAVMTIQPFARSGSIPRVGRMAEDDNEWEWPHHPRFDPLVKKYEGVFAGRQETPGGWADLAVDTLAVNYRIHRHLAMAMRLFDQSHATQIIKLAMDLPELEAHEEAKKRGLQRSDVSVSTYGELTLDASQDTESPTQASTG